MRWSVYKSEEIVVEEICYDEAHIKKVLGAIQENFVRAFEEFVDFNASKNFTATVHKAITDFEHDRDNYKEIFNMEALEEYEDDPNNFKSDVLKNKCPIIRKTLNSKLTELKQYKSSFRRADANELLEKITNICAFGRDCFEDAKKLDEIPVTGLSSIVNDVTFPAFASLQDDTSRLREGLRKSMKALTFANFPMMILLMVIALPLITFLYGQKWAPSAPYFQILCVSGLIYCTNALNTNVIKSLGKGQIYFFVQITKRTLGIVMILFGVRLGIYGLLWAVTIVSYISFVINALVNRKLIDYGLFRQVVDIMPNLLVAALSGVLAYGLGLLLHGSIYVTMLVQILVYAVCYLAVSKLLKMEGLDTYTEVLLKMFHRK